MPTLRQRGTRQHIYWDTELTLAQKIDENRSPSKSQGWSFPYVCLPESTATSWGLLTHQWCFVIYLELAYFTPFVSKAFRTSLINHRSVLDRPNVQMLAEGGAQTECLDIYQRTLRAFATMLYYYFGPQPPIATCISILYGIFS